MESLLFYNLSVIFSQKMDTGGFRMSIRVGIMGYGNLGRGIECALKQNSDMELVAVFTRRDPDTVSILSENVKVYHVDDAPKMKDEIDVMILCGGSATDPVPSILLAISYVIFVSGLHIYASDYKKIWSQLALSFGLLYAGISIANYLIQLVTVIPSIQNGMLEGLALFVSGYSNSIFYALMASYFLMCISLFFVAFVFSKNEKKFKCFLPKA